VWRHLEHYAPRRLWFADLLVRRLDLLVRIAHSESVEPLHRLLLEAVSPPSLPPAVLAKRLGVNDRMLRLLLAELIAHDLVRVDECGNWVATDAGMRVVDTGQVQAPILARRTFRLWADSHTFLPLKSSGTLPATFGGTQPAIQALRADLARPATWKLHHGFPEDIEEILDVDTDSTPSIPGWKRVPFEQGERHTLLVVQISQGRVLGFPIRSNGFGPVDTPCLDLETSAATEMLNLEEPDLGAWRESWREWSSAVRDVDLADVEASECETADHFLRVKAPTRLIERLRIERAETFQSETWLLAGKSHCRATRLLELI
jgi:hypothetical protein